MRMRGRRACGLVGALACLVAVAPANGQTGGSNVGRLEFVGAGTADRRVEIRPAGARRAGELSVVVRNRSRKTGELRLRYFPDSGDPIRLLGAFRARSGPLVVVRPIRPGVRLRPGKSRGIHLRFALQPGEPLSRLRGFLQADLRPDEETLRGSARRIGAPQAARLRIVAIVPPVKFSPSSVTMHLTQACIVACSLGDESHVTIYGDGVAALASGPKTIAVLDVGSKDGGTVQVELRDPEVQGDAVRATVHVKDAHKVGEFSGDLLLSAGTEGASALPMSVTVAASVVWAVVAVFLGALFGVIFRRAEDLRRWRTTLRVQLDNVVRRYTAELALSGARPAGFDIGPELAVDATEDPFPNEQTVAAARWNLDSARDDKDFAAAAKLIEEIADRVQRWIVVEQVARRARELQRRAVPNRGSRAFSACQPWADVRDARAKAGRDPGKIETARRIALELRTKGELLGNCEELWRLQETLEAHLPAGDPDRDLIAPTEIDALYQRAIRPGKGVDVERLILDVQDASGRLTQICVARKLTGYLTFGALTQATSDLATTPLHPAHVEEARAGDSAFRRAFRKQNRRDWIWSLGRALVAATAYSLTIYNDHWGTLIDFLTAFTTGFLTETVVSWAVLPAFQTIRVRWRERSGGEGGAGKPKRSPGSGRNDRTPDVKQQPKGDKAHVPA
jgi:hypothetical protein